MEKYVCLEAMTLQAGWKYVIMMYGEQYVTICGTLMMPELCVDNLDYHLHVSNNITFKL